MISVIVCTYNRCAILKRMLVSFAAQEADGPVEHELILVDNHSSDQTREIFEGFRGRDNWHYLYEEQQGLSFARNAGVAAARGEIVAFLDDDVLVERKWLVNLDLCFRESGAAVVGGRSRLIFEATPPAWIGPIFEKVLSLVDFGPQRKQLASGAELFGLNIAYKKDELLRQGGFDSRVGRTSNILLSGEETALTGRIARAGGRIFYEPDAVVGHLIGPERLAWRYMRRSFVGSGRTQIRLQAGNQAAVSRADFAAGGWNLLLEFLRAALAKVRPLGPYRRKYKAALFWLTWGRFCESWSQLKLKAVD